VDRLQRSCRAYIDACAEPDIARLLTEAPAIMTVEELRTMSDVTCRRLVAAAQASGLVLPGDADVAARLLLGVLNEAAFLVAADTSARRRVRATVDAFVEALVGGDG
jgi:hypothetical protein